MARPKKSYLLKISLFVSSVIGAVVAFAALNDARLAPVAVVVVGFMAMNMLHAFRMGYKEDELIDKVCEKAALNAYAVFVLVCFALSYAMIFWIVQYRDVGYTLAYAACGLMVLYIASFEYYNRKGTA